MVNKRANINVLGFASCCIFLNLLFLLIENQQHKTLWVSIKAYFFSSSFFFFFSLVKLKLLNWSGRVSERDVAVVETFF